MKYRELPNALHLTGIPCFGCNESDRCRIIAVPRGMFIATCEKCMHTTRPTPRTQLLLEMFAFGEYESEK